MIDSYYYFHNIICAGGGCEVVTITRARAAWGKFRDLLPLLSSKSLSPCMHPWKGFNLNSCISSVMLCASECWPLKKTGLARLERNEHAMLSWGSWRGKMGIGIGRFCPGKMEVQATLGLGFGHWEWEKNVKNQKWEWDLRIAKWDLGKKMNWEMGLVSPPSIQDSLSWMYGIKPTQDIRTN